MPASQHSSSATIPFGTEAGPGGARHGRACVSRVTGKWSAETAPHHPAHDDPKGLPAVVFVRFSRGAD